MPAFQLQLEDAGRAIQKALQQFSEGDALVETWRVCQKVAHYLENGERLENLARRLGYLAVKSSRKTKREVLTKHITTSDVPQSRPLTAPPGPKVNKGVTLAGGNKLSGGSHFEKSKRLSLSSSSSSITTLQQHTTTRPRQIAFESPFKDFGPISLLCIPYQLPTRPILAVPFPDPEESGPLNVTKDIPKSIEGNEEELCIIPNPVLPPPTSPLSPILEGGSDDEDDNGRSPYNPKHTVVFVNPFALPTRDEEPSSPPPRQMEVLPPHLTAEEEEKETMLSSEPMDLTGRIKKLLDPPIALGGTSDIFYGEWQLSSPKKVAVKVLRTTHVNRISTVQRRLRREMKLWWMCRHRNVVPLYGFASDFSGLDAMISPWMKNGSASAFIKANKCSWFERLKLLGDVVAGLKYLHHFQPPIIHGDLKPTNVLIADNGDACLCDFGLARVMQTEIGIPSGFTTSNFAGSIRYMAPELLNGEDEDSIPLVNTATDIYALGCVGLEMMTDQIPYANRSIDAQVMHDIIRGVLPARQPTSIGSIHSTKTFSSNNHRTSHARLWALISATWRANPDHRPDIILIGRMLAECRMHQGPQLTAEHSIAPPTVLAIGSNPISANPSLSLSHVGSTRLGQIQSAGALRSSSSSSRSSSSILQRSTSLRTATDYSRSHTLYGSRTGSSYQRLKPGDVPKNDTTNERTQDALSVYITLSHSKAKPETLTSATSTSSMSSLLGQFRRSRVSLGLKKDPAIVEDDIAKPSSVSPRRRTNSAPTKRGSTRFLSSVNASEQVWQDY
ncbi:hypothetical protein FRC18_001389 [Serendipita sp. 400]|nr:hypothetical protein FRC18_001389 [Serendipita sp. 400]